MCDVAAGPHGRSDEQRSTIDERASDGQASDERAGGTSWGGRAGGRASELSSSDARAVAAGCVAAARCGGLWRSCRRLTFVQIAPAHTRERVERRVSRRSVVGIKGASCGGVWSRLRGDRQGLPTLALPNAKGFERPAATEVARRFRLLVAIRVSSMLGSATRVLGLLARLQASRPPLLEKFAGHFSRGWRPGGLEARRGFKSSAEVKCTHQWVWIIKSRVISINYV